MTRAGGPKKKEWTKIAQAPADAAHKDEHGGELGKLDGGFIYSGDRPAQWQDSTNIWVHGYWAWDWANSYEKVASIDKQKHLIKTAAPYGVYGFRKGQRFYFLNILEELDQPGEWFLDRENGILYFWPPISKENSPNPEILFSILGEPLIKLAGASFVHIEGIEFEGTRANGMEIREGTGNQIAGCVFRNIGNSGITISGGSGHRVISYNLFDTGDSGVILEGGDRKTLKPSGHVVENCHFARQGRWSKCYVPAI